ncbi:primosomal protein N' [Nocardia sp. NPDC058379]|uniref:primosomal protein N' n=1 Tax=unclassified Nocardia TaxID=2637762 RepID=UPI00365510DB
MAADETTTAAGHPIARVLPLLSPAHLDRDFDYLVPPELDEVAQPGVRVRVRFAGRLVDGYLLERLPRSEHTGKMVKLERVVSPERVLTPEVLRLATAVAARYAGTRADVLRLAIPPRHARTETGGTKKSTAATESAAAEPTPSDGGAELDRPPATTGQAGADAVVEDVAGDPIPPGPALSDAPSPLDPADRRPTDGTGDEPGVHAEEARPTAGSGADDAASDAPTELRVDTSAWQRYVHGEAYVAALRQGRGARAAWQALPGEDWAARLAELAATVVASGRSAVLMVPDQRDLDRLLAECVRLVGDSAVGLAAGLGPAARYRRWLAVLRGQARIVVGTRAAVFAPARDLGLIAIWDDGDDTYAEPRAPYPHAREVAMLRAHETGAAFVAAGFARTAEIQAVVESGWARDLLAERQVLREVMPRISAPGDTDFALERDALARAVRMPGVAFAAARAAIKENAAVLVQVPRRGYVPSLACAKCRTPARCRHCNGPLSLPQATDGQAASPQCTWCGITEAAFRCQACGARALRAMVIGAARTAEELGRAFPGVPIRGSGGGEVIDTVEPGAQVVVATVGAEPLVRGGYGVALLLDGWALLGRADLRASEDTLRRWMGAAALVRPRGQVIVMAEPALPTVQALVRWDPVHHAAAELEARAEVGFPPAVRLAAVDGTSASIAEFLDAAALPDGTEVLGPVPLPPTARKPFSGGDSPAEVERMLLRVGRSAGAPLARALTAAQAVRSSHRSDDPLRVQVDPVDIG